MKRANVCKLMARVKSLEKQNKVQSHQINWCAEMIFAFSEVIERWQKQIEKQM